MGSAAVESRVDEAHEWASEISSRIGRHVRRLKIDVREGGLILRGEVSDYYTKQLLQHTAMALGAAVLANEVEVLEG